MAQILEPQRRLKINKKERAYREQTRALKSWWPCGDTGEAEEGVSRQREQLLEEGKKRSEDLLNNSSLGNITSTL